MTTKERLRHEFGYLRMGDSPIADNLAIALATYFSIHPDRPENDEDSETGWGEWVEAKTDAVIGQLVTIALDVTRETQPCCIQKH